MITNIPQKRGGRRPYASVSVLSPGRGLNTLISDNLIDDKEASDLENIEYVESGVPTKASGYTQVGGSFSNNPRGLGYYVDSSLGKHLLTVDGSTLKEYNEVSNTWGSVSGASFSTTNQINFTQARGKIYIWDNDSGGASYDGTTLTRPGTMPSAAFSIYYGGVHIAAGTNTQVNRLFISTGTDASDFTNDTSAITSTEDPDNATSVPGASVFSGTGSGTFVLAQFVDISKDDGDRITGLAKFGEYLIIFKEKSIFQLTFDSTGVPIVQAVTKSYGCVSHRSIDNVDNDVFFLSRNGVYVLGNEPNYFNVIRTNELSARVNSIVQTINEEQYKKSSAIFDKYVYYLGVPTGGNTTNDTTLTYDKRFLAWSRWTHVMPEAFCLYTNADNEESLYFTSANSAKVFKMTPGTYSADGSAITARWTSKNFDLADYSSYKRWIDATILFRQFTGIISIEILTDSGDVVRTATVSGLTGNGIGSDLWGDVFFGGNIESTSGSSATSSTNNVPYRLKIGKKARSVKIRISNARVNETFAILGLNVTYRNYSHFVWPSALKIQG